MLINVFPRGSCLEFQPLQVPGGRDGCYSSGPEACAGRSGPDLRSGWDVESQCQSNSTRASKNLSQINSCPQLENSAVLLTFIC